MIDLNFFALVKLCLFHLLLDYELLSHLDDFLDLQMLPNVLDFFVESNPVLLFFEFLFGHGNRYLVRHWCRLFLLPHKVFVELFARLFAL